MRCTLTRTGIFVAVATAIGFAGAIAPADDAHAEETPTYLVAALNGRNEVAPMARSAVGDPDGRAVALVRISENEISFTLTWRNITAPVAAHIHEGATGVNGPIQVPLFESALPETLTAVTGAVAATGATMLANLNSSPEDFYVNLHTAEFPDGALRGQLHAIASPVDLTSVLRGGPLAALLTGSQEVESPGTLVGDPDARATAFVNAHDRVVAFTLTWTGVDPPTKAHIHQGAFGVNGPVAVPLFDSGAALPPSISGVAGVVADVDEDVVLRIRHNPTRWYVNVHNELFVDGALRGQLFRAGGGSVVNRPPFLAAVQRGVQIYQCVEQPGGDYKFVQRDVRATLTGDIAHSFVRPRTGPPQWVASDRSAVTGVVLRVIPNGSGNIAELELTLTQRGRTTGRLAHAVEVLRLNTVGGVAPSGPCDPESTRIVEVPYRADYLFITT